MTLISRRIGFITGVAVVALLVTACAAIGSDAPAPIDELCSDPLVVSCNSSEGGPTVVEITGDASDERVTEFADRLYASAAAEASGDVILRSLSSEPHVLDPEVTPPAKWEITVWPGEPGQFEAALTSTLTAAAVPGAAGIIVVDGWPYATVETLDQFAEVFTRVSATPLFQTGGTYTLQSLDERLRIVHIPTRTTDEAILEIIDVARDYPDAEVLLEAPVSGPQYPTFYVSRLTVAQAQELDARLSEPRLATADVDGYALEYVLGSIGEDGTTYLGGTFGAVPAG